jgi:hypothetical protein
MLQQKATDSLKAWWVITAIIHREYNGVCFAYLEILQEIASWGRANYRSFRALSLWVLCLRPCRLRAPSLSQQWLGPDQSIHEDERDWWSLIDLMAAALPSTVPPVSSPWLPSESGGVRVCYATAVMAWNSSWWVMDGDGCVRRKYDESAIGSGGASKHLAVRDFFMSRRSQFRKWSIS